MTQNFLQRYAAILKFHGIFRGSRRVIDQIIQVDLYDCVHGTNTRLMLAGDDFFTGIGEASPSATMHYQPVFTAAIRRPLRHLVEHHPVVGASSTCFVDLGCGRGKALHVARSILHHATIIGVDLHPQLIADAAKNLGHEVAVDGGPTLVDASKLKLVCGNVTEVEYDRLLAAYDVIIVFNRNSFDKRTTEGTLKAIVDGNPGKAIFYVYSNPVFEDLFNKGQCVFEMKGWHKGWNTKVFRVS